LTRLASLARARKTPRSVLVRLMTQALRVPMPKPAPRTWRRQELVVGHPTRWTMVHRATPTTSSSRKSSQTFGDAQRLPNGNTFITYCNAGVMQEVNADQDLIQAWEFSGGTGYSSHRPSLYGPPPAGH